jgi:D-serine deaminase-like pyridoxal phosphate-dependent protein
LTVLATFSSYPTDIHAIIDAGSKTLTSNLLGLNGYGYIMGDNDASICALNEEHGTIDLSKTDW